MGWWVVERHLEMAQPTKKTKKKNKRHQYISVANLIEGETIVNYHSRVVLNRKLLNCKTFKKLVFWSPVHSKSTYRPTTNHLNAHKHCLSLLMVRQIVGGGFYSLLSYLDECRGEPMGLMFSIIVPCFISDCGTHKIIRPDIATNKASHFTVSNVLFLLAISSLMSGRLCR